MAPALTQLAEPPTLAEASQFGPLPLSTATSLHLPLDYISLAKKKGFSTFDNHLHFRTFSKRYSDRKLSHLPHRHLLPNGDCWSSILAPPASGWVEGCPAPSPPLQNMDVPSPLPSPERRGSGGLEDTFRPCSQSTTNMGSQAAIICSQHSSIPIEVSSKTEPSCNLNTNQNELLALMGRDFSSVNDIMDTLHKLASNPDLLLGDLDPHSSGTGAPSSTIAHSKEEKALIFLSHLIERQKTLERRRRFLLRRLHRVSARGVGITISSQLNSLIRHGRKLIADDKARSKIRKDEMVEEKQKSAPLDSLHTESMKSMSTSDLVNLVKRVEASQNKHIKSIVSICSQDSNQLDYVGRTLPSLLCNELKLISASMVTGVQNHLHHDSDATESSSGGESCDENESYCSDNLEPKFKPVFDRALYQYCKVRGWVASRWSWLQAQIRDLDYRIKQQKKSKTVISETKVEFDVCHDDILLGSRHNPTTRDPAFYSSQDPAFTCITLPPIHRHAINGYHSSPKLDEFLDTVNIDKGCCRTVGMKRFRRRKYVRLNICPPSVHSPRNHLYSGSVSNNSYIVTPINRVSEINVNNSKYQFNRVLDIKCGCVMPLTCILCAKGTGSQPSRCAQIRTNSLAYNSSSQNFSAMLRLSESSLEKCARIDSSFHPVLSRNSEVTQSSSISNFLNKVEWSQSLIKKIEKERIPTPIDISNIQDVDQNICIEDEEIILDDKPFDMEPAAKRKRRSRMQRADWKSENRKSFFRDEDDSEIAPWNPPFCGGSNTSSPCPSPALPDKEKILLVNNLEKSLENKGGVHRRSSQFIKSNKSTNTANSSYDIDNIVIPYSMAAATKLEVLHCKEIPTPKWRLVTEANSELSEEDLNDFEDTSEACIVARHLRSEDEERRKFLKYLKGHVHSRQSRTRRTDSSGTNTPDQPLSPHPLLDAGDLQTPVGSPPPTLASEDSNQSSSMGRTISKQQSQSTVLTLSLSSIRSSLLKSNNCELQHENLVRSELESELRSHRASSESGPEAEIHSQNDECGRVSPFTTRAFPLDDRECQMLDIAEPPSLKEVRIPSLRSRSSLIEDSFIPIVNSRQNVGMGFTEVDGSIHLPIPNVTAEDSDGDDHSLLDDTESGRSTPLSEITASANSADEVEWSDDGKPDKNPPDFTIRALRDGKGGLLMQVMRTKETHMT